ncbi:MAG: TlyA family RNA methyltransferase [Acidobacteria bacterium]|nr:TlyA family RNA methyltransferase [Acidobacteriota bacterium]
MTTPAGRPRRRLDVALVESGLAPTRERAQALILAGRVRVDGRLSDKPGAAIPPGALVELAPGPRPYASRGGLKLAGALDALAIDPAGWQCLDIGASTGGFTDVLLRRGASHVTAVDVGRGLIDAGLRADPRVALVEGVNARYLSPQLVRPPYDLATLDVSFISLVLVLPAVLPLVPRGLVLGLVKPQFELSPREVGRGGVVRDPALRARAVGRVCRFLADAGRAIRGIAASPVAGPKGNREVFVLAAPDGGMMEAGWTARIEEETRREPS